MEWSELSCKSNTNLIMRSPSLKKTWRPWVTFSSKTKVTITQSLEMLKRVKSLNHLNNNKLLTLLNHLVQLWALKNRRPLLLPFKRFLRRVTKSSISRLSKSKRQRLSNLYLKLLIAQRTIKTNYNFKFLSRAKMMLSTWAQSTSEPQRVNLPTLSSILVQSIWPSPVLSVTTKLQETSTLKYTSQMRTVLSTNMYQIDVQLTPMTCMLQAQARSCQEVHQS